MNYYPNYNNPSSYYMNSYPYNLNNMPYGQQVVQQQTTTNTLNGKIVESEDIVRATEIPMGSYGVFPKADLSDIYIKSWKY